MAKFLDLTGMKFGKLTVVGFSRDVISGTRKRKYWNCVCECGGTKEVRTDSLTKGSTKSCGCMLKEISYNNLTTKYAFKPKYKTQNRRLNSIWNSIISRCTRTNNKRYDRYMKRGISICEEWLDFDVFADWALNNGYNENLTIDRIDNDGNYEPCNCRWTTVKNQCRNRSSNIKVEHNGTIVTLIELSEITGISYSCLNSRYNKGLRGVELVKEIKKPYKNKYKNI